MAALTLQFPEVIDAIFKGWTALQVTETGNSNTTTNSITETE